jgi:hypothetical protein
MAKDAVIENDIGDIHGHLRGYPANVGSYRSRPIRGRRGSADMIKIRGAIFGLLTSDHPMTVRQVFYRLESMGVVKKTEGEYKGTVCRLLTEMRRDGTIPFSWIADSTRWMRKVATYDSLDDMLERAAKSYRRSLWANQKAYVEIWLEKDALAGVLSEVTYEWDVPLLVTRGYPSITFLHDAAAVIDAKKKPTYLYYFGDHDPSGDDIARAVEEGIEEFAPNADLYFERVAVTEAQIESLHLSTRPTTPADSRSGSFKGESVEVDAIKPSLLRAMALRCIEQHIDEDQLADMKMMEDHDRQSFGEFLGAWAAWND